GDINSPVLVGGGRVFGPRPRDYRFKLNKKVKQLARRSALTAKLQDSQIIVVENFDLDAPKTKEMIKIAKNLKVDGKKVLYVLPTENKNVTLSVRNVPDAQTIVASDVNTYAVMNSNAIILTEGALESINNI
ncbi:MAG: 50S ribosomal protein L4, partial [Duncaniella sp.]|nr:50S ribosomal protein L4 [Duncaniella sp.]